MIDLNNLFYFAKIVDFQGFAPASRHLGVPKSTLSRRIAQLELELGVRLLQRSSRKFTVTELGEQFYEHCRAMLIEAESAQTTIDTLRAEPRGTIKMTCPIGLLNFHVGEMLARFMVKYPKINIQLEATNKRIDIMEEGIDIALRVRPMPFEDSELVLRVLSDRGQWLVASPQLVEEFGKPQLPGDLINLPSLSRSAPQEAHVWVLQDRQGNEVSITHKPRYITTDMLALLSAASAGVGIVQLPALMLKEHLENGSLMKILPEWSPRREVIHIVFPSKRGLLPSVRCLIDFLVDGYAAIDED